MTAKQAVYNNPPGHAAFFLLTFLSTGTIGPYPWLLRWTPGIVAALLMIGVGIWQLAKTRPAALTMGAYPLLYVAVMSCVNPAMYFSWYFVPLIPGLLIVMPATVWHSVQITRRMRRLAVGALAAAMLTLPTLLMTVSPTWPLSRAREAKFWEVCATLQGMIQPSDWILTPDIGILGWCLDTNVLDPIGLVSPEALDYLGNRARGQLITSELVMANHPEYVIALDQFLNPYLLESRRFKAAYQLIWQDKVEIVDQVQPLYVFRRNDEPYRAAGR
jgi:hypothetical protein